MNATPIAAVLEKLGLPKYVRRLDLALIPNEAPVARAEVYVTDAAGRFLLCDDVLQVLVQHFTLTPIGGDDLIVGRLNVDAEIRAARRRIERTVDLTARRRA